MIECKRQLSAYTDKRNGNNKERIIINICRAQKAAVSPNQVSPLLQLRISV